MMKGNDTPRANIAKSDVEPRQDNQGAGNNAAPGPVHQPADISGQLLRLRARQQHAVIERMQKTSLGNPASLFDPLLVHDRNLASRSTETFETEF